ncbi:hypothetical protein NLX67_15620 [Domibacillus sp. A3M-37]|uniref:hypothetical protein n=1 Tax=Domibacillus sp. A3M-37 TaxID=2962037 RepID=UPI0020B77D53|nr:hypothetical protein [Domibacillus sp. A3M-37]MCP3763801.1 hypothetical protein [Domibacillus sp. A3M-37]
MNISEAITETTKAISILNKEMMHITEQNEVITDAVQNASYISQQTAASVEEITETR